MTIDLAALILAITSLAGSAAVLVYAVRVQGENDRLRVERDGA